MVSTKTKRRGRLKLANPESRQNASSSPSLTGALRFTNAATILKRLEKPPVVVDAKLFDTYVGEYEVGPGFVLRVFREGDKFMTQATGQGVFEIFPESETVFYPRAFVAKLTFVKDADGKVTGLRIDQNGRVTLGKRIN